MLSRYVLIAASTVAITASSSSATADSPVHHRAARAHASCEARFTISQYRSYVTHRYVRGAIAARHRSRLHHMERCMLNGHRARHRAIEWRMAFAAAQRDPCSNSNVIACIREAAAKYGQPLGDALRVARCESGFSPTENYLGHIGVFQFLYPGTWNTTPYARYSVTSAKYNSLAAMWMWQHGRRNEWACM